MSDTVRIAATIAVALVLGYVVPAVFMSALAPSFERGRRVVNYRGREVFPGLGVVWLVWAGCAIVAGIAAGTFAPDSLLPALTLLGPLALVAFALGLVDDAYGNGEDRGFRGHFGALVRRRMTTGMLKLIGIGAASLVVALVLAQIAPWGNENTGMLGRVVGVLLGAAAVALTTNLVNLTDLRPGRALKVYSLLVLGGALLAPYALRAGGLVEGAGAAGSVANVVALLIALLGPVLAVWRFDLGERGMLGDAGANAMGAVAGALIVLGLPLWALITYAAVLLGLNALSERVSFSAVIERTPGLRWLDSFGRLPESEPGTETPATPRPESSGSRYDSIDDTNDRKA